MEVIIDETEGYPVYIMRRGTDTRFFEKDFEVSEEQVIKWEQVIREYTKVQSELRALYRSF